jgi:hypothetical protein
MSPPAEQIVFDYCNDSNAGKLIVCATGENVKRELRFKIRPKKQDEFAIK